MFLKYFPCCLPKNDFLKKKFNGCRLLQPFRKISKSNETFPQQTRSKNYSQNNSIHNRCPIAQKGSFHGLAHER